MKKLFIYRKNGKVNARGEEQSDLIRTTTVHSSFIGIGKKGQINHNDFKELALDLEPTATSHLVLDA